MPRNELILNDDKIDPIVMHQMRQMVANLTSLPGAFTRSGRFSDQIMDPRRDVNAECGYPTTEEITKEMYRELYDRESIATRVVQILPTQCWQSQPTVYEDKDSEQTTPFEQAWDDLSKSLRGNSWYQDEEGSPVWEALKRADILSRIGHFGVILLGFDDGLQLREPMEGVEESMLQGYETSVDIFGSTQTGEGTSAQYTGGWDGMRDTFGNLVARADDTAKGAQLGDYSSEATGKNSNGSDRVGKPDKALYPKGVPPDQGFSTGYDPNAPEPYKDDLDTKDPRVDATQPPKGDTGTLDKGALGDPLKKKKPPKPGTQPFTTNAAAPNGKPFPPKKPQDPNADPQAAQDEPVGGKPTDTGGDQQPLASQPGDEPSGPAGAQQPGATPGQPDQLDVGSYLHEQEAPEEPAKVNTKHKLLYIRSFDESLVSVVRWERDPTHPRFGQPTMYLITINDPKEQHSGIGLSTATVMVHWTRVIHVADNLGSSEVFGVPCMRPVFNKLLNLLKLYGGSAEMYWRGAFPGLALETHPQLGGDVTIDEDDMRAQMERYQNTLQRWLAPVGMSVKTLSPQVVDPTTHVEMQITGICIVIGCPMRVFMGSERGELASSQDDSAWTDILRERRSNHIIPRIIIPFVDRLIAAQVLPEPVGYSAEFEDVTKLKPTEQAQVANGEMDAVTKYLSGGADVMMSPLDFYVHILGKTEEEAEAILEAVAQHQAEANAMNPEEVIPGEDPAPPAEKVSGGFDEDGNPLPDQFVDGKTGLPIDPETGEPMGGADAANVPKGGGITDGDQPPDSGPGGFPPKGPKGPPGKFPPSKPNGKPPFPPKKKGKGKPSFLQNAQWVHPRSLSDAQLSDAVFKMSNSGESIQRPDLFSQLIAETQRRFARKLGYETNELSTNDVVDATGRHHGKGGLFVGKYGGGSHRSLGAGGRAHKSTFEQGMEAAARHEEERHPSGEYDPTSKSERRFRHELHDAKAGLGEQLRATAGRASKKHVDKLSSDAIDAAMGKVLEGKPLLATKGKRLAAIKTRLTEWAKHTIRAMGDTVYYYGEDLVYAAIEKAAEKGVEAIAGSRPAVKLKRGAKAKYLRTQRRIQRSSRTKAAKRAATKADIAFSKMFKNKPNFARRRAMLPEREKYGPPLPERTMDLSKKFYQKYPHMAKEYQSQVPQQQGPPRPPAKEKESIGDPEAKQPKIYKRYPWMKKAVQNFGSGNPNHNPNTGQFSSGTAAAISGLIAEHTDKWDDASLEHAERRLHKAFSKSRTQSDAIKNATKVARRLGVPKEHLGTFRKRTSDIIQYGSPMERAGVSDFADKATGALTPQIVEDARDVRDYVRGRRHVTRNFSKDQSRDDHGRFSESGDSITIDGTTYDMTRYNRKYKALEEMSNTHMQEVANAMDNGYQTAADQGFKHGTPEFEAAHRVFAVKTAQDEYGLVLKGRHTGPVPKEFKGGYFERKENADAVFHAMHHGDIEDRIEAINQVIKTAKSFKNEDKLNNWWNQIVPDSSRTTKEKVIQHLKSKLSDLTANFNPYHDPGTGKFSSGGAAVATSHPLGIGGAAKRVGHFAAGTALSAGGDIAGQAGGAALGGYIGAGIGTLIEPVGGTAVGAAVGAGIGQFVGGGLGGAAGATAAHELAHATGDEGDVKAADYGSIAGAVAGWTAYGASQGARGLKALKSVKAAKEVSGIKAVSHVADPWAKHLGKAPEMIKEAKGSTVKLPDMGELRKKLASLLGRVEPPESTSAALRSEVSDLIATRKIGPNARSREFAPGRSIPDTYLGLGKRAARKAAKESLGPTATLGAGMLAGASIDAAVLGSAKSLGEYLHPKKGK